MSNSHYTVMSFDLKNVGATTTIFHDMLHDWLEDMQMIEIQEVSNHVNDLRKFLLDAAVY